MPTRSLLILWSIAVPAASAAAPSIDPQFGDHAVTQRGKPIVLSGISAPNEALSVSFAGKQHRATANSAGRWAVTVPGLRGGGPYTIKVAGPSGTAMAGDILLGDVWLCSGQSNMEYPLSRALNGESEVQGASDAELRLMKVPQQLAAKRAQLFAKMPSWKPTSPDSARNFSAACYFLTRDLRRTEKVPIGAIDATWGGTPIRAWMDEASVRASGAGDAARVVDLYRTNPTAAVRQFGTEWGAWWRSKTGDKPGQEPWNASGRQTWKPVPSLQYWDYWGPEWKSWIGSLWMRRLVTLSDAEAAQPAKLSLSTIDDIDQTFVNGIAVGGRNDPSNPRDYPVPKGQLKPGVNEILVLVRNSWGIGGVSGPAEAFALSFANSGSKPLATGWEYSKVIDAVTDPPVAPWDGPSGVSTIYNAMIAPLGPLGLKGVAWYQGEADVGQAGYDRRLAAWTASWRTQFGDPQLPFLIVGLAGWQKPASRPGRSEWAALINEQRIAVQRDSRLALASAIDLGEIDDIHPANKQDVGHRLALAAHYLVYRDGGTVGPSPIKAVRRSSAVIVTFSKSLQVLSGAGANAFELCGPTQDSCRYAAARVHGNSVELAADGQPVTRVRHAWADYPIINLYDLDLLPAPVFELPVD